MIKVQVAAKPCKKRTKLALGSTFCTPKPDFEGKFLIKELQKYGENQSQTTFLSFIRDFAADFEPHWGESEASAGQNRGLRLYVQRKQQGQVVRSIFLKLKLVV